MRGEAREESGGGRIDLIRRHAAAAASRLCQRGQLGAQDRAKHTLFLLHVPTFQTLVQETDAKSNVNAHAFLVDHARDAILHEDVGAIRTKSVPAVGDLKVLVERVHSDDGPYL